MIAIPDSMMLLKCAKCGHEADFEEFCHTPITGDLPRGTHQCPNCKRAWRMEKIEPDRIYDCGLIIPGKRAAVSIPTIL